MLAVLIIGIVIGVITSRLFFENERKEFAAYRANATRIVNEANEKAQEMANIIDENAQIAEEKDKLFKQATEMAYQALDMAEKADLEPDNEKYRELKIKYERLLASLN